MFEFAILLIFPAMMAFAAASDLFTMTISNRVSLILVAGFMVLAIVTGMSWPTIGMHVAAGFLVLSIGFVCFAFGWMGGGDAKLAAATALWLGWSQLLDYAIWASLFGGVLTLGLLALRGAPLHPPFLMREGWYARITDEKTGIPYGIALAAAGLILYPSSFWMTGALH
ncbi:A24 family peptidase [Phreatobacter oligotrophus]|jgi:prepilin peptidase CpaA|uniref:Prepilin peptidase CpaA n=1 Tax=Phreatobacter oligotrophus TaxID=1122261 RepID=A0A2T4YXM3_9HYPH|nr:prepilin peptidase [Phreatobacter oligotrophus]PTM51096.1 prepilin peptidase CpaA [Phreatobacter oligotrophus]